MPKQLSLLTDRPAARSFELGDYVTGFDPNGNPQAGYICAEGIKWLILSEVPRCGKLNSGNEFGDYYRLPWTAVARSTAVLQPSPDGF